MTAVVVGATTGARLAFPGVLRSEFGKLTSLRSIRIAALAVVLLGVVGTALRAFGYADIADPALIGVPPVVAWRHVLDVGVEAAQLPAIVFAVLAMGSEYTARVALTTFTAAPRRLVLLAAKAVVTIGSVAVLTAVGLALGIAVSAPLMAAAQLAGPSADAVGGVVSGVVLVVVWAVLALAVTVLTRSTAAGITVVLAVLFVLPVVADLIGGIARADVGSFLLSYAAPMVTAAIHEPVGAAQLGGALAVTLAWLIVPSAVAALALVRRDV